MSTRRRGRRILISLCSLTFVACMVEQALGVPRTAKEPAPIGSPAEPLKPSSKLIQKPAVNFHSKKSLALSDRGQSPGETPVPIKRMATEAKTIVPKSRHHVKVHKKTAPKAVVQPRTDLMHYGVLENSQRYDPRPNPHHAGVPNPQTVDLTHDHFQELDRNQDGKIDPVERAFGRIDMDRDLHNRQLH
jgi:hypothetical protein